MRFSEWLRARLGTDRWVVADKLTARHSGRGYTVAIPEDEFDRLEEEFASGRPAVDAGRRPPKRAGAR